MKKTTFVGNLVAWGAVSVLCVAFLAWSASMGGEFGDNTALLALSVYARPVGAFSIAALLTTLLVKKFNLELGARMRVACACLGSLPRSRSCCRRSSSRCCPTAWPRSLPSCCLRP